MLTPHGPVRQDVFARVSDQTSGWPFSRERLCSSAAVTSAA
jgi:hypothetical protein